MSVAITHVRTPLAHKRLTLLRQDILRSVCDAQASAVCFRLT